MKAIGIIAEYNPFHNGHAYQIAEAKSQTDCDLVIIAMSGNFLQRGEPAIYDKWHRAIWAVNAGADLVVELPVQFSTQAADYFARGGVKLLDNLFVKDLVFGVESNSVNRYHLAAQYLLDHEADFQEFVKRADRKQTYQKLLAKWLGAQLKTANLDLDQPNNILAFTYIKASIELGLGQNFHPIKRKDSHYHDASVNESSQFASATAIRRNILKGRDISQFVPGSVAKLSQSLYPVSQTDFWPFLQYKLWQVPKSDLQAIYQMEPGLENKLKSAVMEADSYYSFVDLVKSKHLTTNKINRLGLYTLLDLSQSEVAAYNEQGPDYIRPLAFNEKGREYLNQIKEDLKLPIISKVGRDQAELMHLEIKAGELYRLANISRIPKQDFTRNPLETIDNKGVRKYT